MAWGGPWLWRSQFLVGDLVCEPDGKINLDGLSFQFVIRPVLETQTRPSLLAS